MTIKRNISELILRGGATLSVIVAIVLAVAILAAVIFAIGAIQ